MNLVENSAHLTASLQHAEYANRALPDESVIFGSSQRMLALRTKLRTVANSNLPVLIEGESGTGKEVIARLLHRWSPVAAAPFLHVSCPAIPGSLLESELFGYKCSPDGLASHKHRRISLAESGTLCLDEIGELDPTLQAKLLQFLQDGKFCPIGEELDSGIVIRLVCAANGNLEQAVEAGTFRRELFYRINVVQMQLPPLRERIMDLPDLCRYFVKVYNDEFNCSAVQLSGELLNRLQKYHWPGNIRQLANLMKHYVVLGSEDVFRSEITGNIQPSTTRRSAPPVGSMSLQDASREVRRTFERQEILRALEANQWNRKRAARALNISYRALLYKLKEFQREAPAPDLRR